MVDVNSVAEPGRGWSRSKMRRFVCKDCQRQVEGLRAKLAASGSSGASKNQLKKLRAELRASEEQATYNENWARQLVERGGARSDRCKVHRQEHRLNIQGLAVAYVDIETVGEVANREQPTGPLGGLGPLPVSHEVVEDTTYDLQGVRVGMTDAHVIEMISLLREKQVLILKAGTGTGKSTFAPYRLMDPPPSTLSHVPDGALFAKLTDLGPIIVTEPRVQAAVGVASFVGGVMSGAGGVGPGYPVGYQVSGDRNHDEACELVYVTDGTMINWLREGRLSKIGTVIVDEAHERSTNIDFILGYLKRELPQYPHLRVIVTSATFNTDFYLEYFGGPDCANVMDIPAEKAFGYGMPLFPNLDAPEEGEDDVVQRWAKRDLPLSAENPRNVEAFIATHWKSQYAEPLQFPEDVVEQEDDGYVEDVWETTRVLIDLRPRTINPLEQWKDTMPDAMVQAVVGLARGLDEAGIYGDILGFLPTSRTIEPACLQIERSLGSSYRGNVFPLISTLPKKQQADALAKRRKGDERKIVISTNLAETSLTVEGVRFVVDSGLILQPEWDPSVATSSYPSKPHSQAGVMQRWGRVGRKGPGWVFPLYTKGQFLDLPEDTAPGSTRENLEGLVMTAKVGGIDHVRDFDWPAAFSPVTVNLDDAAAASAQTFREELNRADGALRAGGAIDAEGHPTSFGRELIRFQGLGSPASALAIMFADRLSCVPEVVMILALLEDTRLVDHYGNGLLLDDRGWTDDWRLEAADRHRGLASLCDDDAELVLLVAGAWERADSETPPWQDSLKRQEWARTWWINHAVLLEAAGKRRDVLGMLSPHMKEEVRRFVEPALIDRARGVITRAEGANTFRAVGEGLYETQQPVGQAVPKSEPVAGPANAEDGRIESSSVSSYSLEQDCLTRPRSEYVVALRRRDDKDDRRMSSLIAAQEWALQRRDGVAPSSVVDAMHMIVVAAQHARPDAAKNLAFGLMEAWPVGLRVHLQLSKNGDGTLGRPDRQPIQPFPRPRSAQELGNSYRDGRGRTRRRSSSDGADADASVRNELRTDFRLGVAQGYDDEKAAAVAELRADKHEDEALGCGECFPCRDDRPGDCERPRRLPERGAREDLLGSWYATTSLMPDLTTVRVVIEGTEDSAGWFEVTGYRREGDSYIVLLRPDWRKGKTLNAGQHPDLKPGDPIDVRVGRLLTHHEGKLRAFDRLDGLGRFVMREAYGRTDSDQVQRDEIAVSLHRANTTLLESLVTGSQVTATVVPGRIEGTVTITLLELLHQHWAKAVYGQGRTRHTFQHARKGQEPTPVYSAVLESLPNQNGWTTARLLHQDGELGVVHRFDLRISAGSHKTGESSSEIEPEPRVPTQSVGDPVLLNLVSDEASLDVSGLSVTALIQIRKQQAGQISIPGLDPTRKKQDKDADSENDEAPPGTTVRTKTEKPLSRAAAAALVGLSDDAHWPSAVWSFWARTHHLKVGSPSFAPGAETTPLNVRAAVNIDNTTPQEQLQDKKRRFTEKYPVFTTVECTVKFFDGQSVIVEVGDIDGKIPIAELSWRSIKHPSQVVSVGDLLRAVILEIPASEDALPRLSVKALTSDPYVTFKERCPVGTRLKGSVGGLIDHVVFLDLGNEVDGSIHIRDLDYRQLESVSESVSKGDVLDVEIIGFEDEKRRVKLSRKRLLPHPYEDFRRLHASGENVRCTVVRASGTHVNVRIGDGVDGVIHVRNLEAGIADASRKYHRGSDVWAQIISLNDPKQQVELSVKAILFSDYKRSHQNGEQVKGVVVNTTRTHAFVALPGGVTGAVFARHLARERIEDVSAVVSKGSELEALILGFSDERYQVELSVVALLSLRGGPSGGFASGQTDSASARRTTTSRSVVAEGETVGAAITVACRQLGVAESAVRHEVLDPGEPKRFLRPGRLARVRVTTR